MVITGPDLTKAPPRSPRVRLGGFVILPRLLDKGRATIAAKNGDYVFNCPMDRRFFDFVGTNANTLMNQLSCGKSDGQVLAWLLKSATHRQSAHESAPGQRWKKTGHLWTSNPGPISIVFISPSPHNDWTS